MVAFSVLKSGYIGDSMGVFLQLFGPVMQLIQESPTSHLKAHEVSLSLECVDCPKRLSMRSAI